MTLHAVSAGRGQARCVKVHNSANQATTTSVWFTCTYDTEIEDTDSFHSTGADTERLTVPAGLEGMYLAIARCEFASNVTGRRQIAVQKNGTVLAGTGTTMAQNTVAPVTGGGTRLATDVMLRLVAADFLTFNVWQNSGGNLDILGALSFCFELLRVGD